MTSQTHVSLQCRCGSLQGQALVPAPSVKYRIVCLCDDCQAYAHFLGQAGKILDANGGTDISPFPPSHIQLTHGGENLRCMRLSPKGMDRWYAGCCNTPIGNTLQSKKTPVADDVDGFGLPGSAFYAQSDDQKTRSSFTIF